VAHNENDYHLDVNLTQLHSALRPFASATVVASAAILMALTVAGCGSGTKTATEPSTSGAGDAATAAAASTCPGGAVNVVVSVDQWGDIVSELGGDCATVTTLLASSSVDPHDYEPSPADAAAFKGAQLVVINGADYDHWAADLAATSAGSVPVIDAGKVTATADGANPHLWYKPQAVTAVADAVSAELAKINPQAAGYFGDQRKAFATTLQPNDDLIATIKAGAAGKSYAATESVFDYQAEALGLANKTPQGYRQAAANESDPSPADIKAFQTALAGGEIDVLIFNTQTEGSVSDQLRKAAEQAGVPVVEVTETVPPGQDSFVGWQDGQLAALAKALGVSA
jgi:zinc/manganese transport system substrate-binding protein